MRAACCPSWQRSCASCSAGSASSASRSRDAARWRRGSLACSNSAMGYGPVAMAFHWLTALLVLAAFMLSPGGSEVRVYAPERDFERALHELIGLSVFALTLLRLAWKTIAPSPTLPPIAP